ncbi:hypothetical protein IW143_002678, partial [Coemansia sp. RSA 520]
MDDAISQFVERHTQLVERERAYEMEQTRELAARLRPTYLQKLGLGLAGLRITQTRTGLGGKLVLTAEAYVAGDTLAPTTLRVGDIVGVQDAKYDSKPEAKHDAKSEASHLSGVVWAITDTLIKIALNSDTDIPAEWRERCSVVKLANDTTYTRILHALRGLLACAQRPELHHVLFGTSAPSFDKSQVAFLDESLNESQRQAVQRAVDAHNVALIHGPPGTGKTHTVVECVRQLVARKQRVLVCGPSNVAVDNLVERLARVRDIRLVRLGHPARILPGAVSHSLSYQTKYSDQGALLRDVRAELDSALSRISKCKRAAERRELYGAIKDLRKEFRRREAQVITQTVAGAQVVLSTLSGAASRDLAKCGARFDVVVIDEATQAVEGECWIAALQAPKLILAGDHHQLPPTVKSQAADNLLDTTLFERVRTKFGSLVCCMLSTQYRMHEDIMRVSSDRLYDGLLVADPAVASHVLSDLDHIDDTDDTRVPLVFIDTADAGMLEDTDAAELRGSLSDQDSKLNRGEAQLTIAHVQ